MKNIIVLLCGFALCARAQIDEGDRCTYRDGSSGICTQFSRCPKAIADFRAGLSPRICSYVGSMPVVCCPSGTATGGGTVATTTKRSVTSNLDSRGCPALPRNATTLRKTGRKAIDKCIDYLELVYPCLPGPLINSPKIRDPAGNCGFSAASLIVGGQQTNPNEFPHMAALGFGESEDDITWQCGGTLVSDLYVLTAGHCVYSPTYGDLSYALLGAHRKSVITRSRLYSVAEIIKHPQYKSPKKYNDIALIKLDRTVTFDHTVRPACLPTEKAISAEKYIATGWGALSFGDQVGSDILMKVRLEPFSFADCSRVNKAERNLPQGIVDDQQMCIGHHTESKDSCQGDSGGPLQVIKPNIYCMFDVVGVVSFGKACGTPGVPGVYTRVYYYTPWIESIIWP